MMKEEHLASIVRVILHLAQPKEPQKTSELEMQVFDCWDGALVPGHPEARKRNKDTPTTFYHLA
jgi:hypothetical protein